MDWRCTADFGLGYMPFFGTEQAPGLRGAAQQRVICDQRNEAYLDSSLVVRRGSGGDLSDGQRSNFFHVRDPVLRDLSEVPRGGILCNSLGWAAQHFLK